MTKEKIVLIGLTGLFGVGTSPGQKVEELATLTVLARRIESSRDDNASSVGIITADELERMQRHRLLDSLDLIPGTQVLSTAGLTGNTGTAIIRGLPSRYQQIMVDGIRVSDSTNSVGNFLANGQLGQITKVEVLRGPQSVLYGSGAGGGVIGYETAVGSGDPEFQLFAEGGSFDTFRTALSARGRLDGFAYGFEAGYQFSANDTYNTLPLHDYGQAYLNLAMQWQLRDDLRFKLSYRGTDNFLETRTFNVFGASNSEIETETAVISANLYYQVNPDWESRLNTGVYYENYRGDFDGFLFGTNQERWTLNWSNEVALSETITMAAGLEGSVSEFENSGGRSVNESIFGAYANFYFRPLEALLLEAGGRYDEHNEFDGDAAWNVGAVYSFDDLGARVHARVSEAYRNPSRLDSEFFPSFFSDQLANRDLKSEQIVGWETGITQQLWCHEVSVTYYQQELDDAIVTTFPAPGFSQRVNQAGNSSVNGLEISTAGKIATDRLRYRLSFTSQFDEEVIDLPDQLVSFDLNYNTDNWLIGAGISYVDEAAYLAPGTLQTDSRTLTRIYGRYQFNESLSFHARIENVFDQDYQLFPDAFGEGTGVEGPGRAVFAGATFTW
ncbi:MAG: TonB-dependent receptor [Akkermansiaceae bacterium]